MRFPCTNGRRSRKASAWDSGRTIPLFSGSTVDCAAPTMNTEASPARRSAGSARRTGLSRPAIVTMAISGVAMTRALAAL